MFLFYDSKLLITIATLIDWRIKFYCFFFIPRKNFGGLELSFQGRLKPINRSAANNRLFLKK